MEWVLLGLLLVIAIGGSLVLPWIHLFTIRALRNEIAQLRHQLGLPQYGLPAMPPPPQPLKQPAAVQVAAKPVPKDLPHQQPKPKKPRASFEQQFGARLPVWVGGIALALAGLYFVKYSIEMNLLSPGVRILLGVLFGAGLIVSGNGVRRRERMADHVRIAQALIGAGIAVLYTATYAATEIYSLMPITLGLGAMTLVTILATILSLRYGGAIAILAMVGGFLTPALIASDEPNIPLLLLYLYGLFTGFLIVIRSKGWWWLSLLSAACVLFWLGAWSVSDADEPFAVGIFVIAFCSTYIYLSRDAAESHRAKTPGKWTATSFSNALVMMGSLLIMAIVAERADFAPLEWALFALLSLLSFAVAYKHLRLYGFAPWVTALTIGVLLMGWHPQPAEAARMLMFFGALFTAGSVLLHLHADRKTYWACYIPIITAVYYAIAYYELRGQETTLLGFTHAWGMIAAFLSVFGALLLWRAIQRPLSDAREQQHVLAAFASMASMFLAAALVVELTSEWLPIALATEVLVLAWLSARAPVDALRPITLACAVLFAIALMPQILLLLELMAYSLAEAELGLQTTVPLVEKPMIQLGLPAVLFAVASIELRQKKDDILVAAFEIAAIALFATMAYYLFRHAFNPDSNILYVKAGFMERGIITNALFAYGIACMIGAKLPERAYRPAIGYAGMVLAGMALFRLYYFDLMMYNPLFESGQDVGETPLLNGVFITYGLPLLWLAIAYRVVGKLDASQLRAPIAVIGLMLAFIFVSYEVRQYFHGADLDNGPVENAEIYSYSVAWLLLGIGMLAFGTYKGIKTIRIASLAVMILTVGKVFLYDASELTGLLRVASFFGLGLSLLGLSWFYTRYVFREK